MATILLHKFWRVSGVLIFFLIASLIGVTRGQNLRDKEKQVKDQILSRPYDASISPRGNNGTGAVNVTVSLKVTSILAVDDVNENLEIQFILRLSWNDPRLSYTIFPPNSGPNQLTFNSLLVDQVWIPDLYIINGIKVEASKPERFIRVVPNGNVNYSVLMRTVTKCDMNLRKYPHDKQTCGLKISSYGSSSLDMRFTWKDDPVEFQPGLKIPKFSLGTYSTNECDSSMTSGSYSCVNLDISLTREWRYFLLQVYIPFSMLVILSWVSYWLHPKETATGRMVLCIFTVSLGAIQSSAFTLTRIPQSPYTKCIDTWPGVCMTFLFTSVVAFAIVNYLTNYSGCGAGSSSKVAGGKAYDPVESGDNADNLPSLDPPNNGDENGGNEKSPVETGESGRNFRALGECPGSIDIIFRIAIPILYAVFLILYTLAVLLF